ncbi:MAG: hypothetical protein J6Q11_01770 [Fibrobacteraceae bacterium]|nr:hypothetical protein [Fibrobacteraceae bacterium]
MTKPIDFSCIERIYPKSDSFDKVFQRIESKKTKQLFLFRFSKLSLAASLLFFLSGLLVPLFFANESKSLISMNELNSLDNFFEESVVSEFLVLDSAISISYLSMEDK